MLVNGQRFYFVGFLSYFQSLLIAPLGIGCVLFVGNCPIHGLGIIMISQVFLVGFLHFLLKGFVCHVEITLRHIACGSGFIPFGRSRKLPDKVINIGFIPCAVGLLSGNHEHEEGLLLIRGESRSNACCPHCRVVDRQPVKLKCVNQTHVCRISLTTILVPLHNTQQFALLVKQRTSQVGVRHIHVVEQIIIIGSHKLFGALRLQFLDRGFL